MKKLDVIPKHDLVNMHTGTLMSRRKALLKCEESFELSDQFGHGDFVPSELIEFKNTPQWKQAYQDLKVVLSTRENIPSKQDRKVLRQAKAQQSR